MTRTAKFFSIGMAVVLVALLVTLFPVQIEISSDGFLSVGLARTNYSALAADITDIKAYAQLETSGCCIHKGNIQLRFDLFLEPDAPGYDIHYVQVVDTTSTEFLKGYPPGQFDKDTGEPKDWDDYNEWWDSLPRVWQNNPFLSVFIFVDATTSDTEIIQREDLIIEQAYKYWVVNGFNLRGVGSVLPISGMLTDNLSSESQQIACLSNLINDQYIFARDGSSQIVLNVGGAGVALANPDPISVGAAAIDRTGSVWSVNNYTTVNKENPANASGTITSNEIYLYSKQASPAIDVWVGAFSASGDVLTVRDSESVGDVAVGSKQTQSGLDVSIESGDYWGGFDKSGTGAPYTYIEKDYTGFAGVWYYSGECIDASDSQTFTLLAGDAFSLYGEGEAAACTEDITNAPSTWSVNAGSPVDANSNYSTGLTYFTVTNNSGGAVDIAISGTDMIGGNTWTLSDTATPGSMIYGLKAGVSGGDYTIIVKKNSPYNNLVTGLADSGTQDWGLKIYTPTEYTDGAAKSGTVTVTATCS